MKNVSLKTLLDYLKQQGFDAHIQEETQQVYTVLKEDRRDFPVFIRLLPDGSLVQLLAFFPTSFNKDTVNDVARLLHLLNKEIDVPGFGIEEASNVVFFRSMVPIVHGEVIDTLFDAYLNTIRLACKTFSPAVEAVSTGAISFDEILKKAQEQLQR